MTERSPSEAGPPVQVGLVDPRPLVRDRLRAGIDGLAGLRVVAVHADWSEVTVPVDGSVVWVGPVPAPGAPVRQVSLEDVAVDDLAALEAMLRAAEIPGPSARADQTTFRRRSAREDEVLAAVARGRTATEIAGDLGISPKAVSNARRRAMAKLSAGSQVEAVARAHVLRTAGVDLTGGAP
jgi:DNA-binding CsgD family transcriptional regulator